MTYREKVLQVGENHSYAEGFNGLFSKYRIAEFAGVIKGGSVLEIGCGEGNITKFLTERCDRVVAIEPSLRFYNVVCEKNRSPKLELHNVFAEDFETGETFDHIVASGVLEHVEDVGVFLAHTKKFMRKDSTFSLTVPNGESLHRRIGLERGIISSLSELGPLDKKVGHFRYYQFETLRKDLEREFVVRDMRGIFLKPIPSEGMAWFKEEYYDALYEAGKYIPEFCAEIFAVCTVKE